MPDDTSDLDIGSPDILKVLMLTGAVVGVISVFQVWLYAGFLSIEFSYTGYELFMKSHEYPNTGYFIYMPLVVLILSISAGIASLFVFTKHERKGAAAGTILGAGMVVATLLYMFYPTSTIWLSGAKGIWIADIKVMDYLDAGAYSALIAGLFIIIGGAIVLAKGRRPKDKKQGE